jgi:hypothetical protein
MNARQEKWQDEMLATASRSPRTLRRRTPARPAHYPMTYLGNEEFSSSSARISITGLSPCSDGPGLTSLFANGRPRKPSPGSRQWVKREASPISKSPSIASRVRRLAGRRSGRLTISTQFIEDWSDEYLRTYIQNNSTLPDPVAMADTMPLFPLIARRSKIT